MKHPIILLLCLLAFVVGSHGSGLSIKWKKNWLYSHDEKLIFGTAWEPFQESFQGVGRCLRSDFRFGGLKPGDPLNVKGKIYLVGNDLDKLLERYWRDFPEHKKLHMK